MELMSRIFVYFQVMDKGQGVEFDSPSQLLQNPGSYFYKMVAATGSFGLLTLAKPTQSDNKVDTKSTTDPSNVDTKSIIDCALNVPRHRITRSTSIGSS